MKHLIFSALILIFSSKLYAQKSACNISISEIKPISGVSLHMQENEFLNTKTHLKYDPFEALEKRGLKQYSVNHIGFPEKDGISRVSTLDSKVYKIHYEFNERSFSDINQMTTYVSKMLSIPTFEWKKKEGWGKSVLEIICNDFSVVTSTGVDTDGKVYPAYFFIISNSLDKLYEVRSTK